MKKEDSQGDICFYEKLKIIKIIEKSSKKSITDNFYEYN